MAQFDCSLTLQAGERQFGTEKLQLGVTWRLHKVGNLERSASKDAERELVRGENGEGQLEVLIGNAEVRFFQAQVSAPTSSFVHTLLTSRTVFF
eukprot:747077-Hanusia_phi.AAC.2